ncbi:MAG: glycosyltransferase family 4 protein [Microgenomates group bacterium]
MRIAIVRGKYLNKYEMQYYEPLAKKHQLVGFGSLKPFHDKFAFPVVKLPSPMDLPDFPFKMPILNRLCVDAQWLFGLERRLRGFDIAHCAETYMHFTWQCLNAKKRGYVKKVVATVSENIPFNNEGIWGRKIFKRRAIAELDHIIAISQRAKKALILEGCDSKKITVIGHHVDTSAFTPKKVSRIKYQVSRKVNILFVGRLELCKGVFEILFVAKELLSDPELKDYDLIFTLIGKGNEKKRLLEMERQLGIVDKVVHKTVPYPKMPQEYQKADIFVAPSQATRHWQEQFSMVLLEAQASGLPIVTTCSGAIPENVGQAAILVPPADFYSLAEAIKKFILNPKMREEYGKKARERAVKYFDIKIGAKKLEEVYQKLLV